MKKIEGEWSTLVKMTSQEAKDVCGSGNGPGCCAFLVFSDGFECIRMMSPLSATILKRLDEGTIEAKGKGGWEGCAWEGEL